MEEIIWTWLGTAVLARWRSIFIELSAELALGGKSMQSPNSNMGE